MQIVGGDRLIAVTKEGYFICKHTNGIIEEGSNVVYRYLLADAINVLREYIKETDVYIRKAGREWFICKVEDLTYNLVSTKIIDINVQIRNELNEEGLGD